MAARNEDESIMLLAGFQFFFCNESKKKKSKERNVYMKRIYQRRQQLSEFVLVNEMRLYDDGSHYKYFGMSKEIFNYILEKIEPAITHAKTHR